MKSPYPRFFCTILICWYCSNRLRAGRYGLLIVETTPVLTRCLSEPRTSRFVWEVCLDAEFPSCPSCLLGDLAQSRSYFAVLIDSHLIEFRQSCRASSTENSEHLIRSFEDKKTSRLRVRPLGLSPVFRTLKILPHHNVKEKIITCCERGESPSDTSSDYINKQQKNFNREHIVSFCDTK